MTDSLLIVFAKAPVPGRVKTRLAAEFGEDRAAGVYRALAEAAWSTCRAAQAALPCALWLYADAAGAEAAMDAWLPGADAVVPQPTGDLGARIAEAFRLGFAAGFRRVAIVGTDVPGLRIELFRSAFLGSAEGYAALGPAADGGFYLLALGAKQTALFRGLPWSAPDTGAALRARGVALGLAWTELETLRDIDTPADWAWFRGTSSGAAMAARLGA